MASGAGFRRPPWLPPRPPSWPKALHSRTLQTAGRSADFWREERESNAVAVLMSSDKPIVEMFRDAQRPRGRNRFSCSLPIWDLLWEIGRAFGWQPKGTTYVMPAKSTVEVPARRDYQPSGSQDQKRVQDADAVAWARALEVAKASPHLAAMLEARSDALLGSGKAGGEMLPGVLDEFIEFAYGGTFEFAICGEDPAGKEDQSRLGS
jgi:hypothetical protein